MTFFLHNAHGTFQSGAAWSFGIETTGSISEATAQTAWDGAVQGFFTDANVTTYYSPALTFLGTSTSTASPTFHQTTITRTGHTTAGTATTPQLPPVLGMVCSFYTAQAQKYGRGRIFLPAPCSAVLASGTSGHMDATIAGNIATALTAMFQALTTAGLDQILYTRRATRSGVAQYTTTAVTARALQGKLHVQKRREDKIFVASYGV